MQVFGKESLKQLIDNLHQPLQECPLVTSLSHNSDTVSPVVKKLSQNCIGTQPLFGGWGGGGLS